MPLAVLPLVLLALSLYYSAGWIYSLGGNSDPEYMYLFNALNILNWSAPFHIDNPGTPLQVLGALVLFVKGAIINLSLSSSVIQASVINDPEAYLRSMHLVLAIMIALALYLAGRGLFQATGKVLPALILQFGLLCYGTLQTELVRISPEPLMIFAALLVCCIVAPELAGARAEPSRHAHTLRPALTGVVLGFGIATKVTFLPLVLLLFVFAGARKKLIVLVSCAVSFVFFTLPIASRYGEMFNWFESIAIHQGHYGQGPAGLPPLKELFSNTGSLFREEPLLFISLALGIACALFVTFSKDDSEPGPKRTIQKFLWSACLIISVQIAITAKHPAAHYLLPSVVIACFMQAVMMYYGMQGGRGKRAVAGFALIAVLLGAFSYNVVRMKTWVAGNRDYMRASRELLSRVESFQDSLKVGFYRSSLTGFALAFGNEWTGYRYGAELSQRYPNTIFYNVLGHFFYSFQGGIDRNAIQDVINKGYRVIMVGTPENLGGSTELMIQTLYVNRYEGIYQLVGFR